jgi:hypothetical protein
LRDPGFFSVLSLGAITYDWVLAPLQGRNKKITSYIVKDFWIVAFWGPQNRHKLIQFKIRNGLASAKLEGYVPLGSLCSGLNSLEASQPGNLGRRGGRWKFDH